MTKRQPSHIGRVGVCAKPVLLLGLLLPFWNGAYAAQPAPAGGSGSQIDHALLSDMAKSSRSRDDAQAGPGLPFDDKIYSLGYTVFLENRNLEDAWLVARAAVRQVPAHVVWRERLAQVSEWTLRLGMALENWLYVARQTQKDAAWQAVLRLAPGQFDDAALVDALRHELNLQPDNEQRLQDLVDAYERLGTPAPAMAYLKAHAHSPATWEMLAELARRAGDQATALESWHRVFDDPSQITPERAMRAGVLALTLGQGEQGLAWLQAASGRVTTKTDNVIGFWRLTGELAAFRQQSDLALQAYRSLVVNQSSEVVDFDALINLLQDTHAQEAAAVAALAWNKFDEPRHLVQAMGIYLARGQWHEAAGLIKQINADPQAKWHALSRLRQDAEFLRVAGSYYQGMGQFAQARQYYEAGLKLDPQSAAMRSALIWLCIDSHDLFALKDLLARHELTWRGDVDVHDALAAAYQNLSLPNVALQRYLQPRLMAHQDDFLWLMSYADALDQNQQLDRAWSLRRRLLTMQWQQAMQGEDGQRLTSSQARARWLTEEGMDTVRRMARVRLQLTQGPGDTALATLRELLRLDRDGVGALSNAAAEVAIGWLQDGAEYSAERGLLWQQYANSQSVIDKRPLWATISVALAEQDLGATGQLLQEQGDMLPRYDRVNAAAAVGDTRLAQTVAFETQGEQPDDDPLHLQVTENLLAFSDRASGGVIRRQLGSINETETHVELHLALSPKLSLDLSAIDVDRTATQPQTVFNPSQLRGIQAELKWRHGDGTTTARLAQRDGLASYAPVQVEHEQRIDNRLSWRLDAGSQLPSEDSVPLRLGGMKSRLGAGLRYQATRLDQFAMDGWQETYRLQTGGQVGDGRHLALNYSHTYRVEAPSVEIGAFWSRHAYDRRDVSMLSANDQAFMRYLPADTSSVAQSYFLPDDFSFYGIQVLTNTKFENDYTRGLRPYAGMARTWHSQLGLGYSLLLGLSGSALGSDQLNLSWSLGKSGSQTPGLTRESHIQYRYPF